MDLFISSAIQILLFVQLSESLFRYRGLIGSTYKLANNSGGLTNPVTANATYCDKDHKCGTGYCHKHLKTCHKCKNVRQPCRRDHVCCKARSKQLECVFGSCRKVVKAGNLLSRCRKDKHCNKGLCCAKSHGEFVCKRKLKKNIKCEVLEGGVGYTVNHNCPCDDGLACMRKVIPQKKRVKGIKPKTEMRCLKIPV